MKQLLTIFAIVACLPVFAQTSKSPVEFKETSHSFGKIPQGKPVTTVFTFKNTSGKVVVIESAVAGCGCTKPEYPETPILKGKSGEIKVTYNAESSGNFKKEVTVKFAGVDAPVVLTIDGEVVEGSGK